jgi:hypothetical protein
MTIEQSPWDVDQWELDQCRYCKGPIDDPTEAYCSRSCELKWIQQRDEHADNSPTSSSVFSSHAIPSIQSTPRSSPASSASSTPEFGPILPSGSVPNLPLDSFQPTNERRHSYVVRNHKYGSSHNPIKKSFPSNYYQSTIGDRSGVQPVFADKSISLGIRKTSVDEIRPKLAISTDRSDKQSSSLDKKPLEPSTPTTNSRSRWSWRRFSTYV